MKFGPLTFQWACLVCVWRSMQSASRAFSSSTALTRVASGRSFLVLNMARLLLHDRLTGMTGGAGLGFQEGQQVLVDLVLEGRAHAVRRARVDLQRRALDDLGREPGRGADGHDLVVVAVQDERRHV